MHPVVITTASSYTAAAHHRRGRPAATQTCVGRRSSARAIAALIVSIGQQPVPGFASEPSGETYTQLQPTSSMAPLQLLSMPSQISAVGVPGVQVPGVPPLQAATDCWQAPNPQVTLPRPLSTLP